MNDLESMAIERIKAAAKMSETAYGKPLICTYSGGKDSEVMLELFLRSGVRFEVEHNHTTVDAPETVYHIRKRFKELDARGIKCTINAPRYKGEPTSMWKLIPLKLMPPTRMVRYCCAVLKEAGGKNRFIATGVRWAESTRRSNTRGIYEKVATEPSRRVILANDNDDKRLLFENCRLQAKRVVNPIIDWSDDKVWNYCYSEHLDINPLYKEGKTRIGCVGCPMQGGRWQMADFARWPKYKDNYIRAFNRMLEQRKAQGLKTALWANGEDVYHWWVEDGVISGQIEMDLGGEKQ